MLFCRSRTTHANACRSSFNSQNCGVITAGFPAETLRPVTPSLGVVTNTEGFCQWWNLSCISVGSSLPISGYMWNIATRSAKDLVSHHFKWRTWPGRGQNCTAFCGGGALGSEFWFLWSGRSVYHDTVPSAGSGYSAGSLTRIGCNITLSHPKIRESTQEASGHSSNHCPDLSFQSSMSPNTNETIC